MTDTIQTLKAEHLKRQNSASNPVHSVWVSANAGAGKTHILVERIIRLLLPPYQCQPHKILCITYTKAAAAEMTERLFKRLGSWITKSDTELSLEIATMIGHTPTQDDMIMARRLFAKALETPGGLKIQTIHGFCEHILRRFPVESGFRKDFTLLSDGDLKSLYLNALEYVSMHALKNPLSPLTEAFKEVSKVYNFHTLIELLMNSRKIYHSVTQNGLPFWDSSRLADSLGLPIDCDMHTIYDDFLNLIDDEKLLCLVSALESGKTNDKKCAEILKHIRINNLDDFEAWQALFLTKTKTMVSRERFITNDIKKNFPELSEYIYGLYDAFSRTYHHHNGFLIYNITQHISLILLSVYHYVDTVKQEQGACDFDDIILRTRGLLSDNQIAPWVLWKLDGGIDHILVDEAQDTAPEQWDIIRSLSQEFFVGDGASIKHRTIFAVGDEKQSIYGFQGAAPEKMSQNAVFFEQAALNINHQWSIEYLRGSFRSSPAIMRLVDSVFQNEAASGVLFGNTDKIEHYAVANEGPGYIEVMPPVIPLDTDMPDAWTSPLDSISATSSKAINAKRIALKIQDILQSSQLLPSTGRPAEPKDIMILLQKRDATMRCLIRELKSLNIPVAGLDRIDLLSEVAILDILALIDFTLYPDDDLSLAQILRSPLCDISEEDLFQLAHNRSGKLWQCLTLRKNENTHFLNAYEFLNAVLRRSDYESPYDFLSFILENAQGRKKFIARLGVDCIDGLDEILNKALNFVTTNSPSLQGFVQSVRVSRGSEKRDSDTSDNTIQIMTIHGAKGLESPIVFLPDCCDLPRTNADLHKRFIVTSDTIPMIIKEGGQHQIVLDQKEFLKKRDEDENRRLLYVALTRAKDWLFIGGKLRKAPSKNYKIPEKSWYHYITQGLLSLEDTQIIDTENSDFPTYIYQDSAKNDVLYQQKLDVTQNSNNVPLPAWAWCVFNQTTDDDDAVIAPSHANDKASDTEYDVNDTNARTRGIVIHKLLELLVNIKPMQRRQAADNFLKNYNLPLETQRLYITEVFNLINHPEFSVLLSSEGLSEVPIIGYLKDFNNLAISGQIDRMVITPTTVLIADYKTDRNLSKDTHLSKQYLLQMALYKHALYHLYPNKIIQCYVIATAKPEIITLNHTILDGILSEYVQKRTQKLSVFN
jgi:ATP-dependent helicase/nuclease subunit A